MKDVLTVNRVFKSFVDDGTNYIGKHFIVLILNDFELVALVVAKVYVKHL